MYVCMSACIDGRVHVSAVTIPELRERVIQYWTNVDATLGQRVADGLEPIESPTDTLVPEPTAAK